MRERPIHIVSTCCRRLTNDGCLAIADETNPVRNYAWTVTDATNNADSLAYFSYAGLVLSDSIELHDAIHCRLIMMSTCAVAPNMLLTRTTAAMSSSAPAARIRSAKTVSSGTTFY